VSLVVRSASHGLGNGGTGHLQIGHPWHDVLPFDHVISQEKLVSVKN
jgi:hypothetical protein